MVTLYLDREEAEKLLKRIKHYPAEFEKYPWLVRLEKELQTSANTFKFRMTEEQFYWHFAPYQKSYLW